ncbi:MAG: transposase [Lentisphaerae bacterium]|nr:transposase [Lentisphaerota bacterium]
MTGPFALEESDVEVMFLQAYSPDLNPIEKMWSQVKDFLRATAARTQEPLVEAIVEALARVTRPDVTNRVASCGYSAI